MGSGPDSGGGITSAQAGRPAHDVFVSYTEHDKPVADAIVARLEQAGIRCWVAPRDVIPGTVWGEAIVEAIRASRLMVVVISGSSNESPHVVREVERAVAGNVVVVPFRIEMVEPSGAMAYYLSSEHWLDAMTPPLESHIAHLVKVAGALLEKEVAPAAGQAPASPQAPPPAPQAQPSGPPARRNWLRTGLIAAGAAAVLGLAGALLAVFAFSGPAGPRLVALSKLAPGDCLQTPAAQAGNAASRARFWNSEGNYPSRLPVVECGELHSAEVFFTGDLWHASTAYPGGGAVSRRSEARCNSAFTSYVGTSYSQSALSYKWLEPTRATWPGGDRRVICIIYEPEGNQARQSVKGSRQ